MATPFLSEIRFFSFSFPPKGWALCNGQTLPINQNDALFSLIGTFFGGDGVTNFLLPNLQGQVPINAGTDPFGEGFSVGQRGGEVDHTLILTEIPSHAHTTQAAAVAAAVSSPSGAAPAEPVNVGAIYGPANANNPPTMAPQSIANAGGSQPHTNLQPLLVINMCIALQGIFPSRD
jgi:microcystin-dependent protein